MPYKSTRDLPRAQTKQYSGNQKKAFMHAFNSAVYDQGLGESRAFKIAHGAAKKARRVKARKHRRS